MKILKRLDEFRKMPDNKWVDIVEINKMLDFGWKYANKKEYKDSHGKESVINKKESVIKKDIKQDKNVDKVINKKSNKINKKNKTKK